MPSHMGKIVTQLNADLAEQRTSLGLITDELFRLKRFAEECQRDYDIKPCPGCGAIIDLKNNDEATANLCQACLTDATEKYMP